ncbi:hypothetical protein AJ79_05006 [Helicocarpus griseus UAMH5409]|uniref:Uncharacterized protein n=1 Tax=Helicocarpus griseus UAMH5409 TaxID=1447875 RepID=A0A2B7XR83_9EURO|nr:hypothetical protein AJ79_05006 [Helicocarpus griseus UAMH5409]
MHDDVPDTIRDQLYAEESLERQRKTKQPVTESTCPPININLFPAQSDPSMLTTPAGTPAVYPSSRSADPDPIIISTLLDVAVEQVASITKKPVMVRSNCLDLKQIYEDQDWDFFVKNGVKGVVGGYHLDVRVQSAPKPARSQKHGEAPPRDSVD